MGRGVVTGIVIAALATAWLPGPAAAATPPHTTIGEPRGSFDLLYVPFRIEGDYTAVQCRLDQGEWVDGCTGYEHWNPPRPPSGLHLVEVRAADVDRNYEDPPASRYFYLSPAPPVITTGPRDVRINDPRPSWEFTTTSDPGVAGFSCGIDHVFNTGELQTEEPLQDCASGWSPRRPLDDGRHVFSVYTRDGFGGTSEYPDRSYFWVDATKPLITLLAPGVALVGAEVKVRIRVTDAHLVGSECSIDSRSIPCRPRTFRHLRRGRHVVKVRATDKSGNVARARTRIRVTR